MTLFHLHARRRSVDSGSDSPTPGALDASRLLPHGLFVRALAIERKRAERSGHHFILMLVDRGDPAGLDGDAENILTAVGSALTSSIRETDIAGWHTPCRVLGVIFPELGGAHPTVAAAALRARILPVLRSRVSRNSLPALRITFHIFPEHSNGHDPGLPIIGSLYPDVAERADTRKVSRAVKRAIDIIGSLSALILLSPVFLLIAVAVTLSSSGTILFRQQRIGQYGKPFTFLKFRSMYMDNDPEIHRAYVQRLIAGRVGAAPLEADSQLVYKITADPRVTRLGRFLRRTSLDELPQFLNVLRNDMSLVGPRPPLQYEVDVYDAWHRRRLFDVKPGITGLWQVNGRNRLSFDEMVRLDLKYAHEWSVWLDLRILLHTPRAVFSGEGH